MFIVLLVIILVNAVSRVVLALLVLLASQPCIMSRGFVTVLWVIVTEVPVGDPLVEFIVVTVNDVLVGDVGDGG